MGWEHSQSRKLTKGASPSFFSWCQEAAVLKGAVSEAERDTQTAGRSARRASLRPCSDRAAPCKVLGASCWVLSSGLGAWRAGAKRDAASASSLPRAAQPGKTVLSTVMNFFIFKSAVILFTVNSSMLEMFLSQFIWVSQGLFFSNHTYQGYIFTASSLKYNKDLGTSDAQTLPFPKILYDLLIPHAEMLSLF